MYQYKHIRINTTVLFILMLATILNSCRAKWVGMNTGSSSNHKSSVDSISMKADSLALKKDTFASFEDYKAYLLHQENLFRKVPLDDHPSKVYVKMPDGSIQETTDISGMTYHVKISNDSIPLFLRKLFPNATFYYSKLNKNTEEFHNVNTNRGDLICYVNGKSFAIPNDVNIIFDGTSKKVSIEEKIEFIISLRNGLNTHYQISSIIPKQTKIGYRLSSYEVTFILNSRKYIGYVGLMNRNEIEFLFFNDENGTGKGVLLMFNSKLSY